MNPKDSTVTATEKKLTPSQLNPGHPERPRCMPAKQRSYPKIYFGLTEIKGHEMRDTGATTKTITPGRRELKGTLFC